MYAIKTITACGGPAVVRGGFDRHNAALKAARDLRNKFRSRFGLELYVGLDDKPYEHLDIIAKYLSK